MVSTARRNGTIATAGTGTGQLASAPTPTTIGSMSTGRTGVTTITNMVPPAGTDIDASCEDQGQLRLYSKTYVTPGLDSRAAPVPPYPMILRSRSHHFCIGLS